MTVINSIIFIIIIIIILAQTHEIEQGLECFSKLFQTRTVLEGPADYRGLRITTVFQDI